MDTIKLHDKTFKPYIKYEEISAAIDKVADQINADFKDCQDIPVLMCTLTGAIMFTSELMKRLNFNCEIVSTKLSSYQGTHSTGVIQQKLPLTASVAGRRVIVIEDIVDTGNTIVKIADILKENGASEVKVCTMLLKPEMYDKDIKLDYVAMSIPNDFIVGFGLDYDEIGRNLKDIYVIADNPCSDK